METTSKTIITIETTINAPVEKVWNTWTNTDAITKWNSASPDWHTPKAEHDLRPGGTFNYRMEAKDGSFGFDFEGVFNIVKPNEYLEYTLGDDRKVKIFFTSKGDETHVVESFEAEDMNPVEMQREGWQAILNNLKNYIEMQNNLVELHFEININAPTLKVFDTMLNREQYSVWTAPFCPTSYFDGSWEKGSKILFIGTDEKGEKGGMVAHIAENIPGKFISIKYDGLLKGNEEVTEGPEVESWAGAYENYTFTEENGGTLLSVDVTGTREYQDFFTTAWPQALNKLKEICEL